MTHEPAHAATPVTAGASVAFEPFSRVLVFEEPGSGQCRQARPGLCITAVDEHVDRACFHAIKPAVDPRQRALRVHVLDEGEILEMLDLQFHVFLREHCQLLITCFQPTARDAEPRCSSELRIVKKNNLSTTENHFEWIPYRISIKSIPSSV